MIQRQVGALLIFVVVGCAPSGASGQGSTSAVSSLPSVGETETPGETPLVSPAEERETTLDIDGDKRSVLVLMPALEPGERAPLLVMLHGSGEGPTAWLMRGADVLAARERVIVVMPAFGTGPGARHFWSAVGSPQDTITDSPEAAYVAGMILSVVEKFPVDPKRVFVAGFSMGAVLTDRIACQAADKVDAVAIVAGSAWSSTCRPSRPVSVLVIHGTSDSIFDIGEGAALANQWHALNDCRGELVAASIAEGVVALTNDECAAGSRVEFVRIEGATHSWVDEPIDATELAWQFFADVPSD
jgi:polyhydroxybutyrate depolymerase